MRLSMLKSASSRLDEIEIELATMGGLVEQQLTDAITAFERSDLELAADVRDRDIEIDEREDAIEKMVVALLEHHRPSGAPLRRTMTALKVAAEMERIGDLAKNVAKRTIVVSELSMGADAVQQSLPVVVRMGRRALGQFAESLDCLFREDAAAAQAVRDADDQIDDLYNSIFREILVSMSQYQAGVALGTHLVFIAKNFERIGDHATNIAERVHYALTGDQMPSERIKTDITSTTAATA